jgi:hypothetical protein
MARQPRPQRLPPARYGAPGRSANAGRLRMELGRGQRLPTPRHRRLRLQGDPGLQCRNQRHVVRLQPPTFLATNS